jgi:hypothetical protein
MTVTVLVTFAAYAMGAAVGFGVDRGGPRLRRDWPVYLRLQLIATASLLTLFSAWQLSAPSQIVAPLLISANAVAVTVAALATKRDRSAGLASLEAWSASPNGAFWVLPVAGAFAGTSASMITALSNAAYAAPVAVWIHLLRRDAPVRQRMATTWVDQSALLALAVGLGLHLIGPAPAASHVILRISGPILAFVGAAMFTGSILHPQNVTTMRTRRDLRRWFGLSAVRVVWLVPIAVLTHSTAVAVVSVLSAFGAPAFNPPQLAVLYGYRSGVVNIAVRWGWTLLPAGAIIAAIIS